MIRTRTSQARKMVLDWGKSERLGHMALGGRSEQVFLGEEIAHRREYSETTAHEVDEEIRILLDDAYTQARNTLQEYRQGLDRLAEALIEKEEIPGQEAIQLIKGAKHQNEKRNGGQTVE